MTDEQFKVLLDAIQTKFYVLPEFWISLIVGLASIWYSFKAFREAKAAKKAAWEAGQFVKLQTITIELSEIAQKLDRLGYDLSFVEARDLLNEVSRRLRRQIAPFQHSEDMVNPCNTLKLTLEQARTALEGIRPQNGNISEIPANSVYFAMQTHFSAVSDLVAEIMGLFEKRTIGANGT